MAIHEVDKEVKELLMEGEEILLTAKQAKGVPGGSISTPNSIYVTNIRVIFKNPKLFGLKADIVDANYRDISNVRLKRGMFSTEIYLKTRNRADEISLPAVDRQIAQNVINLIQKGMLGELPHQSRIERSYYRGQSNNIDRSAEKDDDPYLKLEKLSDLKQKGVLSDSEFQILKNDLLKKISGSNFSNPSIHSNSNSPANGINLNNKVCPNSSCGSKNTLESIFCKECGTKL